MSATQHIDPSRLPQHIAIIMDGNGRWAKTHGQERIVGHYNGVKAVHRITEAAAQLGIRFLTLYAFSTENWNRPQNEVDALMDLFVDTIERETETLCQNNVRLATIGDTNRLPEHTRQKFMACIEQTSHNTGLTLVLALSYSARWELVRAAKRLANAVANKQLDADRIDEAIFSAHLTTADMPDPDLLIRTSGELRISNFLLWQIAYTELYFTDKYWPDFNAEDLYDAIIDYQQRERRFGKTSEQVTKS